MKLIGYGEDALTLWGLTHRLADIINPFGDKTPIDSCIAFFRPSFGRHGGPRSSEFGEFDFIIFTNQALYLGESKWHRSSEDLIDGKLHLRPEQIQRHEILEWYIKEWSEGGFKDWADFFSKNGGKISTSQLAKPLPRPGSLLSENLTKLLTEAQDRFGGQKPRIYNILLYFHTGNVGTILPKESNGTFTIVNMDYSVNRLGNFIEMQPWHG